MDEPAHDQQLTGTVGAELRAARETQQLSLADVAGRTRIPLRHLVAIEAGEYAGLPAATYSAGFVRTYARLLGLDAFALSQLFRAELAQHEPASVRREVYEPTDPARVPGRGLAWGGVLLAILLVLGFLYWRGTRTGNPAEIATASDRAAPAQPAAATPQPATGIPQPAAMPAPPAANPADTALLTADEPVWLRIDDGKTRIFEGVLKAGDHVQVPATAADPRLRTSRATAIKVTVGAAAIPPLGPPETLVKDVSLKSDALLDRARGPAPAPVQPR